MALPRRSSGVLPEAWPTRVRSAVVHAVAIARTSLFLARAEAENHLDERLRLRAEVDRLRTEAALLKEEIRIKDARMERLLPSGVRTTRPSRGSPSWS